jgi:hypothetical protein
MLITTKIYKKQVECQNKINNSEQNQLLGQFQKTQLLITHLLLIKYRYISFI